MDLRVLMIDDEVKNTSAVYDLFNGTEISGHSIEIVTCNDFVHGKELLFSTEYDIVILDIYKGKPSAENPDRDGETLLSEIRSKTFIPVIFFSGLPKHVEHLSSEIIRVVPKSADGNDLLQKEIEMLINTGIPMIKKKLLKHIQECSREYFWDFVQNNWAELQHINDSVSLGYLLARRIAKSFSKSNIKKIFADHKLSEEKIYPMEYYIYPISQEDMIETGDIIKHNDIIYAIVTPSCDMHHDSKSDFIHLAKCVPLSEFKEYTEYMINKSNTKKKELEKIVLSNKKDRFYFLPGTHFIENSVIDFQQLTTVAKSEMKDFHRITKLDAPFAQAMVGFFIRYYNRIGTDDLDVEYIINNL